MYRELLISPFAWAAVAIILFSINILIFAYQEFFTKKTGKRGGR